MDKSQFESTKPPPRRSKTGLKGVSFHTHKNKWRAKIGYKGKTMELGYFNNPFSAAHAYNNAVISLFGSYSYINDLGNFPEKKKFT